MGSNEQNLFGILITNFFISSVEQGQGRKLLSTLLLPFSLINELFYQPQ